MKKLLALAAATLYFAFASAQTGYTTYPVKSWFKDTVLMTKALKINSAGGLVVGGYTRAASAVGDFQSTTKGFLVPTMTTTQRNAISSPANSLIVYNTTDSCFQFYRSNTWMAVAWGLKGNRNTTPWTQFIGPVDTAIFAIRTGAAFGGYIDSVRENTAFGYGAANANITALSVGYQNASFGHLAMASVTTGNGNTALGSKAAFSLTTGDGNIAIGEGTMPFITSGMRNTADGTAALAGLTTGQNNIGLGENAGVSITTQDNNTILGASADILGSISNAIAIGREALVGCSNCIVLGDTTTPKLTGLGTAYPTATLDVHGTIRYVDGAQALGKVLTSDADGDATWQFAKGLLLTKLAGTDGGTVTLVTNRYNAITGSGTFATFTVTFPASPADGDVVEVKFERPVTTLTIDGNGNTVSGSIATALLGAYYKWKYETSTTTWY